jgi:hypothetical protein
MNLFPTDHHNKAKSLANYFPCDGKGLQSCSNAAIGFCAACSRLQCADCSNRHKIQDACNFLDLQALGKAWLLLVRERIKTSFAGLTEVLRVTVPIGTPIAHTEVVDNHQLKHGNRGHVLVVESLVYKSCVIVADGPASGQLVKAILVLTVAAQADLVERAKVRGCFVQRTTSAVISIKEPSSKEKHILASNDSDGVGIHGLQLRFFFRENANSSEVNL